MRDRRIGFAMCGSFCTYEKALEALKQVKANYNKVIPIMSEKSTVTDTRFGEAKRFAGRIEEISGEKILSTIKDAEPIGPRKLLDVLVIAPCTGNTIAKLANGITDSSVTMAAKAHLRNERPVVIAVSTNDGLSANAANIGKLLNTKNIYFVPFGQDDAAGKPRSLAADFDKISATIEEAVLGRQIQPILA